MRSAIRLFALGRIARSVRLRAAWWLVVALAAAVGVPAATAVSSSDVTMTVSGRITDAATGIGLGGMCVTVPGATYPSTLATGTSGSDGSYVVSWDEPSGDSRSYYVEATSDCGAGGFWQHTHAGPLTLTATPGENSASGVDMQALPAGRIIGQITDDKTGVPVAGLDVQAVSPHTGFGETTTRTDGTFLVGDLPPGSYGVGVNLTYNVYAGCCDRSPIGYLSEWVDHVPQPSAEVPPNPPSGAEQFSVSAGQTTTVNDTIYPADTITGRITDKVTGRPLPGVTVYLYGRSVWNAEGVYISRGTDKQGRFSIIGLGPGTYTVCFLPGDAAAHPYSGAHARRCWKDRPYSNNGSTGTPVRVNGFGTTVGGINQVLPLTSPAGGLSG